MLHSSLRCASLVVVLVGSAVLSACVVAPYPRRVVYSQPVPAYGYDEQTVVVDVAPPAP